MRLPVSLLALALLATAAPLSAQAVPSCDDLHLVPAVKECSKVQPILAADQELWKGQKLDTNKELASIVQDYDDSLTPEGVRFHKEAQNHIRFLLDSSIEAQQVLRSAHLKFDPAMHEEGYIIVMPIPGNVDVIAQTYTGLFYGEQTLKQLLHFDGPVPPGTDGHTAVLYVPTIRDWPTMAHRGLSDDWSRGPMPNAEFLKREIRTLAAYKINIFSPYFEHTFAYSSTPVAAFPGAAFTSAEARELVAYAAQYHIQIIPEQESFGHLHHVLKFEQYSPLAETAHGAVLAPSDAGTLPLISSWFQELATVFPSEYAHIGADETFELGLGRTRDAVQSKGLGAVYLDFLTRIHQTLEPNHKRLLFWGDVAVNSPELVGTLPKDMIALPWDYDAKPDFKPIIEPFTKVGLETWVAPGVNNWNCLYPNNNTALTNIRNFVRDGQALGSTGEMNTVWNDDGEGIFDENWFGVLFGAAAGWQPGESSTEQFTRSYAWAFHRDATGKVNEAQRELMAAHTLLHDAKLIDAEDPYFWIDPFSPDGWKLTQKMLPLAKDLRLHAERAITLVAEAKAQAAREHAALQNTEALDALELGARRIDFMAYKFQIADDTVRMYAHAREAAGDKTRWNEVQNDLETIAGNNGRMRDVRDGYTQLRALYEQAWMRVNRPYALQSVLAHFDLAGQLWTGRADQWQLVMNRWWTIKTLPAPSELGLPEVVAQ